jgi:hypothetical protein
MPHAAGHGDLKSSGMPVVPLTMGSPLELMASREIRSPDDAVWRER